MLKEIVMFWVAAGSIAARAEEAPPAPERYVVVKGDSLWNIAEMLYSDGYQWVRIHESNKNTVADPNLILPQQTLILPGPIAKKDIGAPSPAAAKAPEPAPPEAGKPEESLVVVPEKKEEAAPLPPEPPAAIEPLAEDDLKGDAKEVAVEVAPPPEPVPAVEVLAAQPAIAPSQSPAPLKEFTDYEGKIISGSKADVNMISQGDTVYIDLGTRNGIKAGDEYLIIRKTEKALNPATKKKYWLYDQLGKLRITPEIYERRAGGEILFSHEAIFIGDGLIRAVQ